MELFTDKLRTDQTYAVHSERSYSFLNRSGREEFAVVREKLNYWFSRYPEEELNELKRRLQSADQFNEAFFELYVHEFFYSRSFQLAVHPQLEHTAKRPDFLVSKNGIAHFYLEAKVVRDESDLERAYEEKRKFIVEAINKLGNIPYWISIKKLEILTKSSFPLNPIIKKIEDALRIADYEKMLEFKNRNHFEYNDDNIQLGLNFWAREYSTLDGTNPAVGIEAYFEGGLVTTTMSLTKAIEEKAKKYGKLNHPFVIALNCSSPNFFGPHDLETVIGKDCKYIRSNKPLDQLKEPFYHDGIFSKSCMSNVAVLFITWVTPYHPENEQWYWCENPNFEDKEFQKSLINQIF